MIAVDIEHQARMLARENRNADPSIGRVFWFPHEQEIRLVELTDQIPESIDGEIRPFWFRPSPKDGLNVPSRVALIRPTEFGKLRLPPDWLPWDKATEL